jgi:hypothetical protein
MPLVLSSVATGGAVLALMGCHQPADSTDPAPSASASAAPAPSVVDDHYRPSHPSHINQLNPKGGFFAARNPPPPKLRTAIADNAFTDPPPTVTLEPLKHENGHCGEADLGGGEKVVLDCIDDDYGNVQSAASPLVSHEEIFGSSHQKLPAIVDHRKDNTEGPVLNQGSTPACTSFSLVSAVNHAVYRYLKHPGNYSPMHAWARYHTPKMSLADDDNVGKGLTDATTLAFDPKLAKAWMHGTPVDHELLHRADQEAQAKIVNITRLKKGDMNEIKSALASGQDVWFSMSAAHGLAHPKKNSQGESIINDFDHRSLPRSSQEGHAILLSGYQNTGHGTYYLIHNSWGPKWGTDGYAWIWEKTLKANIGDAYVVQAHPIGHSESVGAAPPDHRYATCAAGLAPDATTSQCVPQCDDGGPRVNGVCPVADQCPDGEVNLDGSCELAAPVLKKTMGNGVQMSCGASGCSYVVPNGTAACSSPGGCNVSCAAPRFRVASGPRGLTCTG